MVKMDTQFSQLGAVATDGRPVEEDPLGYTCLYVSTYSVLCPSQVMVLHIRMVNFIAQIALAGTSM